MDSYWDNLKKDLYDKFFYEADNIRQIYRDYGLPVPEYHTHDDSYSHGGNYGSSSTYLKEYSGHTSDEALARYLQEMQEEDGFHNFSFDEPFTTGVGQGGHSFWSEGSGVQDDVNPDEMTYEQISVLGQSIGNVKKGLSEEQISRLPTHKYKGSSKKKKGESADEDSECVICKMQYDKRDVLMTLPCAHKYHAECIKTWLTEDKSCCVCKVEVAV